MRTIFLIACTFLLSAALFAQHDMKDMPGMKMSKKETKKPVAKKVSSAPSQKVIYTCVMHPEVKMDEPGNCPKCGMKLIKKTVTVSAPKTAGKTSRNNAVMDTTSDKHDITGMDMQTGSSKMDGMKGMDMSKGKDTTKPQPDTYTCVMHPEIHSSKPGNCPKCGMKLVKEKTRNNDKMQMDNDKPMDMGNM
ncbi:MAG: heavy metal-binding domain-containing protein, partial [Chitinophagaceae bacterium]